MAAALGPVRTPTAPRGLVAAGEAVIGVSVGTVLRPRRSQLDRATAVLGLIPGGAPGAIADRAAPAPALAAAAGLPATPPAALQQGVFAAVGLGVGLSFDRDAVRRIGGALRPILLAIAAVLLGCGGLGLLLAGPLGVDPLSAYLATTPGGLSAVLAPAQSTGADLTLVVGLQSIRLLLTVAAAPLAARTVRVSRGDARPQCRRRAGFTP